MSSTTAFLITPAGQIEHIAEFRNSHGFGPFVWSAVCAKYLGGEFAWSGDGAKALWPLWKDARLPLSWRVTLLASYDYAIIEKARFAEFAGLIRAFVLDVGLRDRACHWPAVADLLDKHASDDVKGMCFHGTSISEDVWHPWGDEEDEGTTYDLTAGTKHFFVGSEIDSTTVPAAPATPEASDE